MKEKRTLDSYNEMPVFKAVLLNALPAIAAMLMTLIYNLADTYFIGKTNDAYQVAAVSLATPLFMIFMTVGTVFGIGGTVLISRSFGEGKNDLAKKASSFCMWGSVVSGILLYILIIIFKENLLTLLGASEMTRKFTDTYLTIVSVSGPFAVISGCFSNILRSEGQAGKAMTGQILGNVLNMCLDAVLIMVFHMGIVGCAVATLIGEIAGALYYIVYLMRGTSALSIRINDFSMGEGILRNVFVIGFPAALGSLLMSVSSMVLNGMMAQYGDMAVAGIGVAAKISMITGMISLGVGQGIQPLFGYAVGAKNWTRFKKTMNVSLALATLIGCVMTAFCYLFMSRIAGAFLTDPEALDYAVNFCRVAIITGPLFGIYYVTINAIQSMGAGRESLIINVSRQGFIYIPMLFLMNVFFGITGLVWAQPIADITSLALSMFLYSMVYKRLTSEDISTVNLERARTSLVNM